MIGDRSSEMRDLTPSPRSHCRSHSLPRGRQGVAEPEDDGGEEQRIHVNLPEELPPLSLQAARLLLEVLVQLTTVEVLDPLPKGVSE
jgi:hypothetical protein